MHMVTLKKKKKISRDFKIKNIKKSGKKNRYSWRKTNFARGEFGSNRRRIPIYKSVIKLYLTYVYFSSLFTVPRETMNTQRCPLCLFLLSVQSFCELFFFLSFNWCATVKMGFYEIWPKYLETSKWNVFYLAFKFTAKSLIF